MKFFVDISKIISTKYYLLNTNFEAGLPDQYKNLFKLHLRGNSPGSQGEWSRKFPRGCYVAMARGLAFENDLVVN